MQLCMAWMSVSALLHSEDDDALCSPVLVLHDHNAHRIGTAHAGSDGPEHCFICHNLSLRSLVATAGVSQPASGTHSLAAVPDITPVVALAARRPARAPPLA
jgi:hypothetical protein